MSVTDTVIDVVRVYWRDVKRADSDRMCKHLLNLIL